MSVKQIGAGNGSGAAYVQAAQGQGQGQDAICNDGDCCPETRRTVTGTPERQIDVEGQLTGRMGFEISERDRVEVTDVRLDVNQAVNFGDPRVVSALSDISGCSTERQSTTLLEIPFSITKSGRVHIELDALTEIVAKARTMEVDQAGFTATPRNQ